VKIKISADSALDVQQDLIDKYDVSVFYQPSIIDGTPYYDSNCTPQELIDFSDKGASVTTSAINVNEYDEAFTEWLKEYDAIVHISLSHAISVCGQNAITAGEGKPVYVVDSRSLSTAGCLIIERAGILARQGLPAAEIALILNKEAYKVETSFVLSTLKFMVRGGRCSSVAALGANLLKLKPCIENNVTDGKLESGKKYKGTIEAALIAYTNDKLKGRTDIDTDRPIYVTHSVGTPDEAVQKVVALVHEFQPFGEVRETVAGLTISTHCGPGTLGLLFWTK